MTIRIVIGLCDRYAKSCQAVSDAAQPNTWYVEDARFRGVLVYYPTRAGNRVRFSRITGPVPRVTEFLRWYSDVANPSPLTIVHASGRGGVTWQRVVLTAVGSVTGFDGLSVATGVHFMCVGEEIVCR